MLVFSRAFLKLSSGAFAKSQPSYLVWGIFIALFWPNSKLLTKILELSGKRRRVAIFKICCQQKENFT